MRYNVYMETLYFFLYLAGALCLLGSAFGATVRNVQLLSLGLFFWILVPLIQVGRVVFN